MNLNILKYPERPCCLQNGDFEDKSKNVREVSGMPAAEPRGRGVKHKRFWKINKLPFLNASSFLDSWNKTGKQPAVNLGKTPVIVELLAEKAPPSQEIQV